MDDLSVLSDWRMWAVLLGVCGAIVFYCWEKFALELVSVVILCVALVFFEFFGAPDAPTAATLLAGFANPALLTIMALLVVGQGIFHTGALDGPTRTLLSMFDVRPKLTIITLFALVFGVSAFINNTPVVVMFIPILGAVAARGARQCRAESLDQPDGADGAPVAAHTAPHVHALRRQGALILDHRI